MQSYVLDGRINVDTYNSLSNIKLNFIKDMLEKEDQIFIWIEIF